MCDPADDSHLHSSVVGVEIAVMVVLLASLATVSLRYTQAMLMPVVCKPRFAAARIGGECDVYVRSRGRTETLLRWRRLADVDFDASGVAADDARHVRINVTAGVGRLRVDERGRPPLTFPRMVVMTHGSKAGPPGLYGAQAAVIPREGWASMPTLGYGADPPCTRWLRMATRGVALLCLGLAFQCGWVGDLAVPSSTTNGLALSFPIIAAVVGVLTSQVKGWAPLPHFGTRRPEAKDYIQGLRPPAWGSAVWFALFLILSGFASAELYRARRVVELGSCTSGFVEACGETSASTTCYVELEDSCGVVSNTACVFLDGAASRIGAGRRTEFVTRLEWLDRWFTLGVALTVAAGFVTAETGNAYYLASRRFPQAGGVQLPGAIVADGVPSSAAFSRPAARAPGRAKVLPVSSGTDMPGVRRVALVNPDGAECSVCLEPLRRLEMVAQVAVCGHLFHAQCLEPWLRDRSMCPNCRAEVSLPGGGGGGGP